MWGAFGVVGKVVLTFDSAVNGGEAHSVAVVGSRSLVVDDTERVVFGLACVFTVCKPVNAVANVVGGTFDSFLDKVRVQAIRIVAEFVVNGGLGFALAGHTGVVGIPPRPLCGAVRAVLEFGVSGVEVALAVVGHVKSNPHRSSYLPRHTSQ